MRAVLCNFRFGLDVLMTACCFLIVSIIISIFKFKNVNNIFIVLFFYIMVVIVSNIRTVQIKINYTLKDMDTYDIVSMVLTVVATAMIYQLLIKIAYETFTYFGYFKGYAQEASNIAKMNYFFLKAYILAPIIEEYVFRGKLQGLLKTKIKNIYIVILIQALFFGLQHDYAFQKLYATIFGIISGVIKEKYQTLIPSTMLHIFSNILGSIGR